MIVLERELWTDGSVYPNPGPGGWAVVDESFTPVAQGYAKLTTNNEMEGRAILAALELLEGPGVVWTDSRFWVDALNEWCHRWKRGGWVKPANNQELAKECFELYRKRVGVRVAWLRGHAGNQGNEAADHFANRARTQKINTYQRKLSC